MGRIQVGSFAGQGELLLAMLRDRTRRMAVKLEAAFAAAQAKGLSFYKALNSVALLAYKAAECHSAYVMARNNWSALPQYVKDPATRAVLSRLFDLCVLIQVRENCGDWMDVLDSHHLDLVHERIMELLTEIRPDAVALTDGFDFDDRDLKSTLGRHDGNVYEAIYEEARRNPLNKTDKMVGWDNYAKQFNMKFLQMTMKGQRQGKL